ncbi:MAG: hypothetical protein ABF326_09760, partial [Arenicellales bacterium]
DIQKSRRRACALLGQTIRKHRDYNRRSRRHQDRQPGYYRSHRRQQEEDGLTVIEVAPVDNIIAPIIFTIPLQILAYRVALIKGTDVDKPRNLAKSVTVE